MAVMRAGILSPSSPPGQGGQESQSERHAEEGAGERPAVDLEDDPVTSGGDLQAQAVEVGGDDFRRLAVDLGFPEMGRALDDQEAAAGAGGVLPDGSPIIEVGPTSDCPTRQVEEALANRRRVLLYLGFDVDPGFDEVLLGALSHLGGVTSHREFSVLGRAAVLDLGAPPSDRIVQLARKGGAEPVSSELCVSAKRAGRW